MTKKPKKAKSTPAKPSDRRTVYANIPRELAERIETHAEQLGYPHTMSSVIYQALADRFPAPAVCLNPDHPGRGYHHEGMTDECKAPSKEPAA